MIIIKYCKGGEIVSDFDCYFRAETIKKIENENRIDNKITVFHFASSNIINAIRLEIVRENIDYKTCWFVYKHKYFRANEYGVISDWPKGFCDIDTDICEQILRTSLDKRRKEKKQTVWESQNKQPNLFD